MMYQRRPGAEWAWSAHRSARLMNCFTATFLSWGACALEGAEAAAERHVSGPPACGVVGPRATQAWQATRPRATSASRTSHQRLPARAVHRQLELARPRPVDVRHPLVGTAVRRSSAPLNYRRVRSQGLRASLQPLTPAELDRERRTACVTACVGLGPRGTQRRSRPRGARSRPKRSPQCGAGEFVPGNFARVC